ncbi:uncharacterized protein PHACADRAFT_185298 [Phanerochaete carnosa HHB-10118-sp]|uniref:Uncharacterized protein n=1 Tax=Phanerochaete carnosa (strain HHB-10118-sp) TaxID=650164 RepID=K5UWG0_PHACS|nr:uncharacterized protein PHACADRAFT_185298 [Phanerochaete carnosa HHB-10118-sp]EKM54366.1 hypothetical protein PHACADRAFT_185298 [Phanerochaete carnosa HHB-10118-sp]
MSLAKLGSFLRVPLSSHEPDGPRKKCMDIVQLMKTIVTKLTLTQSVSKTLCKVNVTVPMCTHIAFLHQAYVEDNGNKTFWPFVDKSLADLHKLYHVINLIEQEYMLSEFFADILTDNLRTYSKSIDDSDNMNMLTTILRISRQEQVDQVAAGRHVLACNDDSGNEGNTGEGDHSGIGGDGTTSEDDDKDDTEPIYEEGSI